MLLPIILSGGVGARFWPVSRQTLPKPFIELPDGGTLLQKTLQRAAALDGVGRVLTITNQECYFLTRDAYAVASVRVDHDDLLEPMDRNTTPAIAAVAWHAARHYGKDTVPLMLSADHMIVNQACFSQAVASASALARADWLVTFDIVPTRPETGYGYIEEGHDRITGTDARQVVRFVEKPDAHTAREYLESGCYTWNSGMFCFTAGSIITTLREHAPEVWTAVDRTLQESDLDAAPIALNEEAFALAPDVSIDYAVMEHAANMAVIRTEFDWSGVGSWRTVAKLVKPDTHGNRVNGETLPMDVENCYIQSESRIVARIGLENLLVVDTPDALLAGTNESTYIPAGHKHRLENPEVLDVVMIEIQSGQYLGENDIVRFQDIYGCA